MTEIPKIRVVAAVVVRADGKILCARRGNAKNPCVAWKWEFPGGKIDAGETAAAALARELLEEMDFPVIVGEKITTVCHSYPNCEIEMDAFFCVPANADAQFVLREHVEARWLAASELSALDWAAADLPIVKKLSA
ncbi:MAG: NUDIX domain-containing protein [Opitutales bacterium]|nr:NUDIX domain-containing protein [Opitutales bacterium]